VVAFPAPGQWIGVAYIISLLIYVLILFFQGKTITGLFILFYLATIEPIIRTYIPPLPYLGLEYYLIGFAFGALLLRKSQKLSRWAPAIFYLVFLLLEFFGLFKSINLENARSVLILSAAMSSSLILVNYFSFSFSGFFSILTHILIGVINILVVIAYGYVTNTNLVWGSESSLAASGGMGPVQISMILALGIIGLIISIDLTRNKTRILYLVIIALIFIGMILTFSRNGLYLVIIACFCYFVFFKRPTFKSTGLLLLLIIVGLAAFNFGMKYAGEALIERFSDYDPTNRDTLIVYGWQIFLENPLFGVGTGNFATEVAKPEYFGRYSGAHNEFIRASAEHGILGLFSWTFFVLSSIWIGLKNPHRAIRAIRMTLLVVFLAYTAVNGIKLLIQPLLLLAALSVDNSFDTDPLNTSHVISNSS
jgi:O-antigen ligase